METYYRNTAKLREYPRRQSVNLLDVPFSLSLGKEPFSGFITFFKVSLGFPITKV